MAYVRSPNETWQKKPGESSGLYSEGGSGVAGGTSSAVSNQQNNSKAGNAAGWYNIQDFLGANKGNQTLQNQIKNTGNQYIENANTEAQSQIDEYNSYERPEVQAFDPNNLKVGGFDEQTVQKGLNQDYDPFDVKSAMGLSQSTMNPYNNIQSGSVQSLTDFNKQGMKPNAQYTGGMQSMDNALLGSDYDFVNNYGDQFKSDFENQALNPFNEQLDSFALSEANRDKAFEDAQSSWRGGLQNWLTGQNSAVDSTYNKLTKQYTDATTADPRSFVDDETLGYYDAQKAGNAEYGTDLFIPEFSDYIRQTGGSEFGPTRNNAAFDALGGREGIDYYNALSSLYGDATAGSANPWDTSSYSGAQWTAPTYEFDKDAYWNTIRNGATITEAADEYTPPTPVPEQKPAANPPNVTMSDPNNSTMPTAQDIYREGTAGANWIDENTTGGEAGKVLNKGKKYIPTSTPSFRL